MKEISYKKAFKNYEDVKKLYYFDPLFLKNKSKIIDTWRKIITKDALEFEFPILVPKKVLEESGHLKNFKDQIFETKNLCLRPETASAIYPHFKQLKIKYKEKNKLLKISQYGKSFRNQSTTRDKHYRLKEFEQLELEILYPSHKEKNYSEILFQEYINKTKQFFTSLKFKVYPNLVKKDEIEILKEKLKDKVFCLILEKNEIPHYSKKTIDFYYLDSCGFQMLELGSLSDRGNHDLKRIRGLEEDNIFESSLGLTRINLLSLEKEEPN